MRPGPPERHRQAGSRPNDFLSLNIRKLISGGQTGADRAGLDFSLTQGIPIGGWCPRDRRAEDGVVPLQYPLQEHAEASYQPRTVQNLAAADFTAIFSRAPLSPGSRFTLDQCRRLGKPHLWLRHFPDVGADARLLRWALREFDGVLNISGSRESKCPGMHQHVLDVLRMAIA